MLQYLVARRPAAGLPVGHDLGMVAQGEMIVLEGPWPLGAPILARRGEEANGQLGAASSDLNGYVVEALAPPGPGDAFVIGAHRMRDPDGFRPYAEQVAAVVERFNGRFLARAGKVTPLGGAFVPERAVIIEFPTAADAVAFYVSDLYAPLLEIRHATTDPRFVIVTRSGPFPVAARAAAESYLRLHPASAH
jgi:uncharacterized protein (DUF1330 family)